MTKAQNSKRYHLEYCTLDSQGVRGCVRPVYFPFTFISNKLLREITVFWNEVIIYQPSGIMMPSSFQTWIDQGILKIRTPLKDATDERRLQQTLRSSQCWGEMHQGYDIDYLKAVNPSPPCLDTTTSRIIADLKGFAGLSQMAPTEGPDDKGFAAQFFLHLAQDYDQRSDEVRGEMQGFERNQDLLKNVLHPFPEEDNLLEGMKVNDLLLITGDKEQEVLMIEQRIRAWNYLFQQDGSDTDFLFTDSRRAISFLLGEAHEKFEILQCRPSAPFSFYALFFELMTEEWSEAMQEKVTNAIRACSVRKGTSQVLLRCYLVPNQSLRILLGKACATGDHASLERLQPSDIGGRNTLLGLLEWVGRKL
jgi:hypothetical protein